LWSHIWAAWLAFVIGSFLLLEFVGLSYTPKDTLTDTSRTWLHVVSGQSPLHWNTPHQLAAGLMLLFMVWLFGHIFFGVWG
jgi:hypothetical protein